MQITANNFYRWLYINGVLSGCGSGIIVIPLSWSFIELTGKSINLGLSTVLSSIILIIILPVYSVLLDKFSTKRIYLFHLFINTIILMVFALHAKEFNDNITLLLIAFIYATLTRGLDQVTRTVLARQLVNKDNYHELNRNLELIREIIFLLSGLSFIFLQKYDFFVLLILCLILNVIAFFGVHLIPEQNHDKKTVPEKIAEHKETPQIPISLMIYFFIIGLPYITIAVQNIIYPSYVQNILVMPQIYYSLIVVPYAIGAFLANYLTKYTALIEYRIIFPLIFLIYLIVIMLVIFIPNGITFYIAILLFSIIQGIVRIERLTLLMHHCHTNYAARAIGYYDSITTLAILILTLICCLLTDYFSVTAAWILIIVVLSCALITLLILPSLTSYKQGVKISQ